MRVYFNKSDSWCLVSFIVYDIRPERKYYENFNKYNDKTNFKHDNNTITTAILFGNRIHIYNTISVLLLFFFFFLELQNTKL